MMVYVDDLDQNIDFDPDIEMYRNIGFKPKKE